jgi:hypothetical protein
MYRPVPSSAAPSLRHRRDVLELVEMLVADPIRPETFVVPLDRDRVGGVVIAVEHVDGYHEPLYAVAEFAATLARSLPHVTSAFLVAVRPDAEPRDVATFHELEALAEVEGLDLLDVFVYGRGTIQSLREASGLPSRW